MKKLLSSLLVFITMQSIAQINFSISEPSSNQVITGTSLNIFGTIFSSTYEVARVVSNTNGHTDTLTISPADPNFPLDYPSFSKSISLIGFPQNVPVKLKITATDVLGNQVSDSVYYTYSPTPPAPRAFILSPTAGTNVYSSLAIRTSHTGTDTCTSYLSVTLNGINIFRDTSVFTDIDTVINLSSTQLGTVNVSLIVKDKWNQSASATVAVFSDNNPFITPVYTGSGLIKDYNYHKILEARTDSLYIIPDNNLQLQRGMQYSANVSTAYSTPYGALWSGSTNGSVEFTNDSLYRNAPFDGTAGKYVVYLSYYLNPDPGHKVMLKDMLTRSTTEVGDMAGGSGFYPTPVVADNGTVVWGYADATGFVKSTPSAPSTILIFNNLGEIQYFNPVTDGKNVLFLERNNSDVGTIPNHYKILWHDGITTNTLSDIGAYGDGITLPPSPAFYTVANGFIAYVKQGNLGQMQVWFRDTTGVSRQLTNFGSSSYIKGLNDKGDLIYSTPLGAYYLKYGQDSARAISLTSGKLIYRDSSWYVINGRYLYKFNTDAFRTAASGNWTNAASWEYNTIPSPNADVIVTTNILVNANASCNSLHVVPPGSITVAPGVTFTVLH